MKALIAAVILGGAFALGLPTSAQAASSPPPPPPATDGDFLEGAASKGGVDLWGRDRLSSLGAPGEGAGAAGAVSSIAKPTEYGTSLACHNSGPYPNPDSEPACGAGYADPCAADPKGGPGPATAIWSRELDPASGQPLNNAWSRLGITCLPDAIPAGVRLPVSMVVDAFHRTPWAHATLSTQPKGEVTLVGLKTFFKASWQPAGFEPGEIESIPPARMLGFRVEVRPKLGHYVWTFGDGATFGPTTSAGGVYPDGDVVHAYRQNGTFTANVSVTFGADYRINGGPWQPLPGQATVAMPGTPVTVKEARGVLVNR